jgi:hypothetical protein
MQDKLNEKFPNKGKKKEEIEEEKEKKKITSSLHVLMIELISLGISDQRR